ncbi:MAG: response regulator [Chloroflexota bacterium]
MMGAAPHILVVDDDRLTVKLIEQLLQRHGYVVSTAANGAEGLEMARTLQPDLVILDLMMPVIDGYEVYSRLKGDAQTAGIGILVLSAIAGVNLLARRGAAGGRSDQLLEVDINATNVLGKPIKTKELLNRVASLLPH